MPGVCIRSRSRKHHRATKYILRFFLSFFRESLHSVFPIRDSRFDFIRLHARTRACPQLSRDGDREFMIAIRQMSSNDVAARCRIGKRSITAEIN